MIPQGMLYNTRGQFADGGRMRNRGMEQFNTASGNPNMPMFNNGQAQRPNVQQMNQGYGAMVSQFGMPNFGGSAQSMQQPSPFQQLYSNTPQQSNGSSQWSPALQQALSQFQQQQGVGQQPDQGRDQADAARYQQQMQLQQNSSPFTSMYQQGNGQLSQQQYGQPYGRQSMQPPAAPSQNNVQQMQAAQQQPPMYNRPYLPQFNSR